MEQNLFPTENSIQEWSAKIIVGTLEDLYRKRKDFKERDLTFTYLSTFAFVFAASE